MLFLTLELLDSGARPPATVGSPSRSMRKHAWRGRVAPKATPLRHGTLGLQQIRLQTLLPAKGQPLPRAPPRPGPLIQLDHGCRAQDSHLPATALCVVAAGNTLRTRARTHVSLRCSRAANTVAACAGPARAGSRGPVVGGARWRAA